MIEPLILDFSAHDKWDLCPAAWYEAYVNKRRKKWKVGQRDDALALGSLVHEGLRVWQQTHTVEIPEGVVEQMTPTRECFSLAQELVYGYAQRYPEEYWPLILCEEPLQFPLVKAKCSTCGDPKSAHYGPAFLCINVDYAGGQQYEVYPGADGSDEVSGLAKIDAYFYNPTQTTVECGQDGLTWDLSPGWWIHEYKTLSPYTSLAMYMQHWETNLQASYQTMALTHWLNTDGRPDNYASGDRTVQGVLINVLQKPKRYIPKRKCGACDENYDFVTWIPTGTGQYACPVCGIRRKIEPLKETQPTIPPNYFRIVVTRSAEELDRDRRIIEQTAQSMLAMRDGGLTSIAWTKKNCVNLGARWGQICDYWGPHAHGESTLDDPGFEEPEDYRGLVQVEVAI